MQADGGHFEQLVWVLKGKSVTVHVTTYLNKCTVLLLSFLFIYCTLKIRNSWTIANWTHVYMTFWLSISPGIKFQNIDLNSWDTLYAIVPKVQYAYILPTQLRTTIPFDRSAVNSFVLNMEMRVWDSRFVTLEAGYICGS